MTIQHLNLNKLEDLLVTILYFKFYMFEKLDS